MAHHLPPSESQLLPPAAHGPLSDMPAFFLDEVGGHHRLGLDVTAVYQALHPQTCPDGSLVAWFHQQAVAGGYQYGTDYWFHITPAPEQLNIFIGLEMACRLSQSQTGPLAEKLYRHVQALRERMVQALNLSDAISVAPALEKAEQPINTAQAQWLKKLAGAESQRTGEHSQTVWARFQSHFGINSYLNLPADRFEEACLYFTERKKDPASPVVSCLDASHDEVPPWADLQDLDLLCELKGCQAQAQRIRQVAFAELQKLLNS